ncbi:phosphate uptake regulator PhoU [Methanofollis fontis]|uniref:PhoU family transcriptional regulator n=1 Tax=Methanofollis fontis TaxID=2052832 RepID=A0A483CTL3_9EURY|nr:phosphate uptake regulator PhoU [Methanofollis fontis]TAJ44044.1 PhoU family transcriptional regulator [Methanofollis fontis]
MEIRKVQITGGSSYIVSLPKEWIKSSKIAKNDPVGLIVQQDGTLLVTPKIDVEAVQREKTFQVNATTDQIFILRCLISAYIAGYTVITLTAQGRLPPKIRMRVRDFTQMAIGQEVVEETETSIRIKDLLNPSEMPFQNTIRRMAVLARGMHQDSVEALKSGNTALAEDVIARDNDVDRLQWLIARQANLVLNDANLSRRMNVSPQMALTYFLIARIIERIGDHGTRIARSSIGLTMTDQKCDIITMIDDASTTASSIFDRAIESLFSQDIKTANATIQHVEDLEEQARAINTHALDYDAATATALVSISDSIRRIGEYSGDICESIINHLIHEETPIH